MLGIGGQTLQTVGDQLPQRADVLVFGGEHPHLLCLGVPVPRPVPQGGFGQAGGIAQLGQQLGLGVQGGPDAGHDGLLVKVGVGDGGEQVEGDQMVDRCRHRLSGLAQGGGHGGKAFAHIHQQVLHGGHVGLFAADAHHRASFAAGGLLTLITKHLLIHG